MINRMHFPLNQAFLCLDLSCQEVGNDPHCCPACASHGLLPLANVLNRKERYEPAPGCPPPVFRGPLGAWEKELREERRGAAAEAYWKEKQGDEYGAY